MAGVAVLLAAAAAADEPATLEMVTVVGKHPQPLSQVAAAVSLLPRERIDARVAFDVADLLRQEPGVAVRNDPARFGVEGISIRGLGGNRVLLETDGVPAPRGFAVGSFAAAGRGFADLELVERVEVLRGPASALYGSDAIAGVVATHTLDPAQLLGSRDAALRARSGYASDDHSAFVGAIGAWRTRATESLLAAVTRRGGELQSEYDALDANPRDYRAASALGRVVFTGLDAPLRLTLGWDGGRARTDVDSLELSGGRFANTTRLDGDDRARGLRAVLDQQWLLAGPVEQLDWRLYAQQSHRDQRTREWRRAAGRTPAVEIARAFEYAEDVLGGELTLALATGDGALARRVVGLEAQVSRVAELRRGRQYTPASGATTTLLLGEALPVRDFPITRVTTLGLYAQDDWRPRAGWSLIPALRVDGYWLSPEPDGVYRADNPRQRPVSLRSWSASPRLGLTRELGPATMAFVQLAQGFRAPPHEDVNIGLDLPQFNTRAIPNPQLRPERSHGVEAGLRFAGALSGSVSAYASRYRDFIESKVNVGTDPVSGATLFQSRNVARARIVGIEAGLRWSSPPLAAGGHVLLEGSAAWARGDDTAADRPLNSIEPWRVNAGAEWRAGSGRWALALAATTTGAKDRVHDGATPLARTAGWTTADLTLRWQPAPSLRLDLALRNLADRAYYEWQDVNGRPADDPRLELYRRPGRNVALALTWTP